MSTKKQNICILLLNGTNDPLKCHLGVVVGWSHLKNGHDVTFVQMGEAGSVINEDMLRDIQGFGLPPITKFLDDPLMKDVEWWI